MKHNRKASDSMRELFLQPEIQSFQTFAEFVDAHHIGQGEPSDVMFEAIQADAARYAYSRVIAVGGGTAIDIAKALCAADGRNLDELFDAEPSSLKRTKTLYCLPTTCGTGSEVTVTAVFDRTRKGTKMGLTNYALGTDYAVLIPSLLTSLPASVFGSSSIDALIHAIESYLDGLQATAASRMFAEKAITMILPVYRAIREKGMEERKNHLLDMQLASTFAGIAIANALPSASHAMGYPFAGKFHRPHGEACYVFLDATMQKYLRDVQAGRVTLEQKQVWENLMRLLSEALELPGASDGEILKELDALLGVMLSRKRLKEYGATPQDCIDFGKSCYANQQRLMACAFTPFTEQELIETFQSVYA